MIEERKSMFMRVKRCRDHADDLGAGASEASDLGSGGGVVEGVLSAFSEVVGFGVELASEGGSFDDVGTTDPEDEAEPDAVDEAALEAELAVAAFFMAPKLRSRVYAVGTLVCSSGNQGISYPSPPPTRTVDLALTSRYPRGMMSRELRAPCVRRTLSNLPEFAVPFGGIEKPLNA